MKQPYYQTDLVTLYQGSCLDIHPQIESQSVDFILTDLPYGVTACSWDKKLPLDRLWQEWKRIIKPKGAIALFGTQPFTSELVMSNRDWFKWEDIWYKTHATGHLNCKIQPLRQHENILIFGHGRIKYNPQVMLKNALDKRVGERSGLSNCYGKANIRSDRTISYEESYPRSVIEFSNNNGQGKEHPTQKPIALLQYLIRTYTNEGDTVLDSTCGSGSTLVAAQSLNRKSIGIELDEEDRFCAIAASRLGSIEPDLFRKEREATGQYSIFDLEAL